MAPKKLATTNPTKKMVVKKTAAAVEPTKSYKDLVTEGLISLNDRKGSSRNSLKKFIETKYPSVFQSRGFDYHFNSAIKKGVETNDFSQPKGPSGTVKLVKKAPVKKITKVAAPKKVTKKDALPKKAATSVTAGPLTYKQMIFNGITSLNSGKGTSRSALKKFIQDKYFQKKPLAANFTGLFNGAIRKGLETNDFAQPKGPSGIVKVNKAKR